MARRLLSAMTRMRGGPTLGGSGTRVHIYDDEALTTPSTVYRRSTGVGEQPNPLSPNAGRPTTLAVATLVGDTTIDVVTVAGFQVGDLIPIYDATDTVYRVVTAIDSGLNRLTLDLAIGIAFLVGDNVGNTDMRGHIWGWLDDLRDYYVQTEDIASGRVMPPLLIPTQVPETTIEGFEEGVSVGERGRINAVGAGLTFTDDPANSRLVITHGPLSDHSGTITDAGHGTRTTASAHAYSHITGTHGDTAHDDTVLDVTKKWALIG